ncbi:ABC transporter ATP-binding protein [Paenibacillus sp. SYP-B4298]|uniref:ABC transporter ATP-binding protein n=1 Tax=Paenibacillus sp. SYP-B4298 TaxID=2996034 RepID=UPI0022DE96F8|nr:dipeptide/oligopeptide/nickel ABC transporter ATP-binding protein [Paenibacillus sp. SYP-B4298]
MMLKVEQVEKSYPMGGLFSRRQQQVLHGISLECGYGECVGIIGASGSGKSTLARLMLGIEKPDRGTVQFAGREVSRREARGGRISAVFQDYTSSMNPFYTVEQVLLEPLRYRRSSAEARGVQGGVTAAVAERSDGAELPRMGAAKPGGDVPWAEQQLRGERAVIRQAASTRGWSMTGSKVRPRSGKSWPAADRQAMLEQIDGLLHEVGLDASYRSKYPHELSGGQAQRVCIARALATDPSCIVLDEAVSSLDGSVQLQVLELLKRLRQQYGMSYIFITHDLQAAAYLCDRVVIMHQGRVEETVAISQLRDVKSEYAQRLLQAVLI